MKTLVIWTNWDGFAVQLKNHVLDALTELNCEWRECHVSDMVAASREFQPVMNMVFHPSPDILRYRPQLAQLHGHKLWWTMEDPYECDVTFAMLDEFYYLFTSDPNTAEALRRQSPGHKIVYVPHACNPRAHRPLAEVPYDYRSDILFVGNAYRSRLKFFREHADEFRSHMVTIIGVGYRGLHGYSHQRLIHGHISEPEMVKYINGAKLVLNLHRQNDDLDMANAHQIAASGYNNRYYEVAACGARQLVYGRGDTHVLEPEQTAGWTQKHSYVARLSEHYINLLDRP